MIFSILQLIGALSVSVGASSNSDIIGSMNPIVENQPGVHASENNTDDDLKIFYYDFHIRPFSNDFLDTEWKKGLNLLDIDSITWTEGFYLDSNGNPAPLETFHYSNFIQVNPSSTYTLSGYFEGGVSSVHFYDSNGNWITPRSTIVGSSNYSYLTFTTDASVTQFRLSTGVGTTDIMLVNGSGQYAYQPYHSDSELFDIFYDWTILSIDLTSNEGEVLYQNYFTLDLGFSFSSRVSYNGSRYSFTSDDVHIGFHRQDYDDEFPNYPYLNYYNYSSWYYLGANFDSIRGNSPKVPLIYSSSDSYSEMYFDILNETFTSSDNLYFSLCFEYMNPNDMQNMLTGLYGADTAFKTGFEQGQKIGYDSGYSKGHTEGYDEGKSDGYDLGKTEGIAEGREQVIESGQTASVIFNGIISVGLLPTNVFLQMLNLEVFGINIGALVSSLLTIMVIIIVGRMLFGGKSEV